MIALLEPFLIEVEIEIRVVKHFARNRSSHMPQKKSKGYDESISISLEFITEIIAILMQFPGILRGAQPDISTIWQIVEMMRNVGKDSNSYKQFQDFQDSYVEQAIFPAALLAAAYLQLPANTAQRRIGLCYSYIRFVYFDIDPSRNLPHRDPKKPPSVKENDRFMEMVWETLQHVPVVKEELEKQKAAGRLTEWKREQRSMAIGTYNKLKNRFPAKITQISNRLREVLLSEAGDDSGVKT